jgi:hypothetical protein
LSLLIQTFKIDKVAILSVICMSMILFISFLSQQNAYSFHETPSIWSSIDGEKQGQPAKWVGYGWSHKDPTYNPTPDQVIKTEVKGIVVGTSPEGELYLVPDANYYNLVIRGNILRPKIEDECTGQQIKALSGKTLSEGGAIKDGFEIMDPCSGAFAYNTVIKQNLIRLGLSLNSPIIKMETSTMEVFGPWLEASSCDISWENGEKQWYCHGPEYSNGTAVSIGDHVKVTGLWAIELQHVMWYVGCHPPFLEGSDCFGHTEFHPYTSSKIEPAVYPKELKPYQVNTESHTTVAPIYSKVHVCANAVFCAVDPNDGRLVDASEQTIVHNSFFIKAPPKPPDCITVLCEIGYRQSNIQIKGPTELTSVNYKPSADVKDPASPCYSINQELIGLERDLESLYKQLQTASTGEKPALLEAIKTTNDGITAKKNELEQCSYNNPGGLAVDVTVKGTDVYKPTIYKAEWSVWWKLPPKPGLGPSLKLDIAPSVPWGGSTSFTATLTDNSKLPPKPIAGRTVTFTGTGVIPSSLSGKTDSTGKVIVIGTSSSTINTGWTVQAHFLGDNVYRAVDSATMTYNTVKHATSLTMELFPPTGCVPAGGRLDVGGVLTDKTKNSPLVGKTISIVGKSISTVGSSSIKPSSQTTDSSGGYTVKGLAAPTTTGNHQISAQFAGDPLYDASSVGKILKVVPAGETVTPTIAPSSPTCSPIGPVPPN